MIGLATSTSMLTLTLTACTPLTRSASSEATPSATARAGIRPASAVASSRTHRGGHGAANLPGSDSGPGGEGAVPGAPAVVVSTVDGDTVHVRYRGRLLDVRLIGVDTPETVDPSQPVQCFGEAASRFTARRLTGSPDPSGVRPGTPRPLRTHPRLRVARRPALQPPAGGRGIRHGQHLPSRRAVRRTVRGGATSRTCGAPGPLARVCGGSRERPTMRSRLSGRMHPLAASRPRLRRRPLP